MPRRVNPGTIVTGPGKTVPGQQTELGLIGVAGAPASPNIGEMGYVPPGGTVLRSGIPAEFPGLSGLSGALNLHIDDPKGAHQAVAISIDGFPQDLLVGDDVESALDELSSSIPDVPTVGNWFPHRPLLSGIPDWGSLKLEDWDVAMNYPGGTGAVYQNSGQNVYPFYWVPPTPTDDNEFQVTGPGYEVADYGKDPRDAFWNVVAVAGGGPGTALAGGFTRGDLTIRTDRIYETPTPLAGPTPAHKLACISGIVFPADRGVLALIHWPAAGALSDFTSLDLLDRCIAALLLGQGILGESCFDLATAADNLCDGAPGGIFGKGVDADGNYDPFAYPGRASGQYNLNEIHRGLNAQGEDLKQPWKALGPDPTVVSGWPRVQNADYPGAGQVRLGTDANADIGGAAPVQPYGIPILGARRSGYSPVPPVNFDVSYRAVGNTLLEDTNFFRYRLPWLEDYSYETGLKYTPRGEDPRTTCETQRYFATTTVHALDADTPNVFEVVGGSNRLLRAGDYRLSGDGTDPTGNKDYWNWQLARYRHSFALVDSDVGTSEEIGSYILIHFKTERDFEAFVRDGVMPWDATNPYTVYSASVLDGTLPDDLSNLINQNITGFAPDGPAPDFGYGGPAYHAIRANCRTTVQTDPTVTTGEIDWESEVATPAVMWVSGIAYLVPWDYDNDQRQFNIEVQAEAANLWSGAYRVDDNELTGDPQIAPADLSSPCPMFLGLAPFSYQLSGSTGYPNWTYSLISAGSLGDLQQRLQRVELPLTAIEDGAGTAFNPATNPPAPADVAFSHVRLELDGDHESPSFRVDAAPRVFLRKPLADIAKRTMPYTLADGYGFKLEYSTGDWKLLFHSTNHQLSNPGLYGNFKTGVGTVVYATLESATKDTEEMFLDEVYRYMLDSAALTAEYGASGYLALTGPGKGVWHGGVIPIPVRAGTTAFAWWAASSWVQMDHHLEDLTLAPVVLELQVAGLPDRNPPYTEDVTVPFPSAGLLRYPSENFGAGYFPDNTEIITGATAAPLAAPQFNYSTASGTRQYLRVFDVAYSHSTDTVQAAGQPFVLFQIDGLQLEDFAYTAPGPGRLPDTWLASAAIEIKVPGMTTWLDLGRPDGAGPGKSDAILDGAGCQVSGPYTFNSVDPITGVVFCQVLANVGPFVNLGLGHMNEVPIMVRVRLPEAAAESLTFDRILSHNGSGQQVFSTPSAGANTGDVRGIVGIKLVRLDEPRILGSNGLAVVSTTPLT